MLLREISKQRYDDLKDFIQRNNLEELFFENFGKLKNELTDSEIMESLLDKIDGKFRMYLDREDNIIVIEYQ